MFAANRALHLVTPIERANQETKEVAAPDEELTGKYLREKGDEFFHHYCI